MEIFQLLEFIIHFGIIFICSFSILIISMKFRIYGLNNVFCLSPFVLFRFTGDYDRSMCSQWPYGIPYSWFNYELQNNYFRLCEVSSNRI